MSHRSTKLYNAHGYRPLAQLELSAKVVRSMNGWDWYVLKADGTLFNRGRQADWNDAISDATINLNHLLKEQGALEVSFNPGNWIDEDRPKSYLQAMNLRRDPARAFSLGKKQRRG